jgi:hypothetical protein
LGFEVRLCSAVPEGLMHKLRWHSYLFLVGALTSYEEEA